MILDQILKRTERRVARLPDPYPPAAGGGSVSLARAIRNCDRENAIIAEIKCASPSRGVIRRNVDMAMMAGVLGDGGCVALSVLTEPYFFGGTSSDIARVKSAVSLPVLRKDFIIDRRQIPETRALGADAVLLIAAILKDSLPEFVALARAQGLEPLVEVRNTSEAEMACTTGADLVGINNRDLATLRIDRSTTKKVSKYLRKNGCLVISESGMRSPEDIREMRRYCDAFLIGSSIMSHPDPGRRLEELACA